MRTMPKLKQMALQARRESRVEGKASKQAAAATRAVADRHGRAEGDGVRCGARGGHVVQLTFRQATSRGNGPVSVQTSATDEIRFLKVVREPAADCAHARRDLCKASALGVADAIGWRFDFAGARTFCRRPSSLRSCTCSDPSSLCPNI